VAYILPRDQFGATRALRAFVTVSGAGVLPLLRLVRVLPCGLTAAGCRESQSEGIHPVVPFDLMFRSLSRPRRSRSGGSVPEGHRWRCSVKARMDRLALLLPGRNATAEQRIVIVGSCEVTGRAGQA
jgi:hypothetical protein